MQELEQRVRVCELRGVEASTEVQLAARRVADENRKLRALLSKHGVGDESVDVFLQSGVVARPCKSPFGPQFSSQAQAAISAAGPSVQALEGLLTPRRPRQLSQGLDFGPRAAPALKGSESAASTPAALSLWDVGDVGSAASSAMGPAGLSLERMAAAVAAGAELPASASSSMAGGSGATIHSNSVALRLQKPLVYKNSPDGGYQQQQLLAVSASHYAVSSSADSDGSEMVSSITSDHHQQQQQQQQQPHDLDTFDYDAVGDAAFGLVDCPSWMLGNDMGSVNRR